MFSLSHRRFSLLYVYFYVYCICLHIALCVDMIDQTTLGHQYILQEFGPAANPTVGWQIDPFGHSATQASLLSAGVGFNSLFFGRIESQDHQLRQANKDLQFIWQASPSDPSQRVWTEVALGGNYGPPAAFCWDYQCFVNTGKTSAFIQDDPHLEDYNVAERVGDFVTAAMQQVSTQRGELSSMSTMFQMGSDFQYESAEQWYINLDKLIRAVNANGTVKAVYSTPSQYVAAKLLEGNTYTSKVNSDFMPLGSTHNYWTGQQQKQHSSSSSHLIFHRITYTKLIWNLFFSSSSSSVAAVFYQDSIRVVQALKVSNSNNRKRDIPSTASVLSADQLGPLTLPLLLDVCSIDRLCS